MLSTLASLIDDYLARPWVISSDWVSLVFLPVIPQVYLSYLVFSPNDTRLLRRVLVVPVLALSLFAATCFRLDDPLKTGQTNGIRGLSSWFYMRAIEVALLASPPKWLGYEVEGRSAVHRDSVTMAKGSAAEIGANGVRQSDPTDKADRRRSSRWTQFVNGITYFFAFRLNLGWSNSLGNSDLIPKPLRPYPRVKLLLSLFASFIPSYLLYDASLGLLNVHPSFRKYETSAQGSVWEPLDFTILGGKGRVSLGPLASAIYVALAHAAQIILGIHAIHHYILIPYTLFHSKPVNAPPLVRFNILTATSLSDFWSRRWHQMFRRSFTFLGGLPPSRLARHLGGGRATQRWASIVGTFAAGGIQHAYLACYLPTPEWRAASHAYVVFFALQPVALAAERLFLLVTGRKVSGPLGAIWSWGFMLWAGIPVVDAVLKCTGAVGQGGADEGMALMPFGAPARTAWKVLGRWVEERGGTK